MHYTKKVLQIIIAQYFTIYDCFLQIYDYDLRENTIITHGTITYESNHFLHIDYAEKCNCFLIISDNPLEILEALEHKLKYGNRHGYENRKYIVVAKSGFIDMFNSTSLNFLMDVLVIKPEDKERSCRTFELFTHRYVGVEDQNQPVLLDYWFSCNSSFKFGNNLFPDKISDGKGRSLIASGCNYIPYALFDDQSGLEMVMIKEYALLHNMSIVFHLFDSWGQIFDNWTGIGVLGSVVMEKADIGFSATFATSERLKYVDFTKGTAFSRVSCIVPGPKRIFDWSCYLKVFEARIWILILAQHIFGSLVIFIKTKSSKNSNKKFSGLIQFGIILGIPSSRCSYYNSSIIRFINAILYLAGLVFVTLYISGLLSIFVAPLYSSYLKTSKDLAESNIVWGELQIDWVLPLITDDNALYIVLKNKFRVKSYENLRKKSIEGHFAFGTERLMSGYYAIGDYFDEDAAKNYKPMKEDLYNQYTAMELRKNSVLLPSINAFILRAKQAGLINYWEAKCMLMHSNSKIQKSLKGDDLQQWEVKINLMNLQFAFSLWGICLIIATIQFFKELYF